MSDTTSFEISVRKVNKPKWKEHLPPTTSQDLIASWIEEVERLHANELSGSFQIVIKTNGGYGKNPETGQTLIINLKGELQSSDMWTAINT